MVQRRIGRGELFLVSKTTNADDAAIREVIIEGRRYRLSPVAEPLAAPPPSSAVSGAAQQLTARELQVAALVADGFVNKQIADSLRISEWTVSTHLRRIFAKLGVDTRAAMVSRCLHALPARRGS